MSRGANHKPTECRIRGCHRSRFAKGLCQTHHRQLQQTGETRPIRPYRPRVEGTVKLAGQRVSAECADEIKSYAREKKLSIGAVITEILQGWVARKK